MFYSTNWLSFIMYSKTMAATYKVGVKTKPEATIQPDDSN